MKFKLCAWKCGRKTDRRCGICLECCEERDRLNRAIDAGTAAYVPPEKRPGHSLYKGNISTSKQAALAKATAARMAKFHDQTTSQGPNAAFSRNRPNGVQTPLNEAGATFITDARSY
jgi:hypothetical protein